MQKGKIKPRKTPTFKQRRFVEEYIKNNGNGTRAALIAYKTKNYDTAHALAVENLQKQSVANLIQELAFDATLRMKELGNQSRNLPVAYQATKDILDRAGFKPIEKSANFQGGSVTIKWGNNEATEPQSTEEIPKTE